jgi:hypothetical protein
MPDPAIESVSADGNTPVEVVERDPKIEAKADKAIADAAGALIAMTHPDGGTSDAFKTNKAGNIMVPAEDVSTMAAHGFAIVDA